MKKLIATGCSYQNIPDFNLKIKFTMFFFIVTLFQIQANSEYLQNTKISLNLSSVKLSRVFTEIENKTSYRFFYKNEEIDLDRKVSIKTKKESIKSILIILFKDSNETFKILDKQIIISRRNVSPTQKQQKPKAENQQFEVNGTISDESGLPLPGVSILEKGTTNGTMTDFDGNYSFIVKNPKGVLVFSSVGFDTQEIPINNQNTINTILTQNISELEQVVLVGYGEVKKQNLTGSVGVVDIESFQNQAPTVNVDQALQGQVSGVLISSPNGQSGTAAKIRIRGTSSLSGSNQPLFVIDGIPIVPESNIPIGGTEGRLLGNELNNQGLSTPIGNLNPSDIESISVLKDASAAAIYGSRAANGVIIINTKKGTKRGKPQFNVDISTIIQETATLDVLDAQQFREVWTKAVQNGSSDDDFATSVLDGSYFGNANTNWENEISPGTPISTNVYFNVRGGNENTQYSTSIATLNSKTQFQGSESERHNFNLSLNTKITSLWSFGTNVQASFFDQSNVDGGLVDRMYIFRPDIPVFDEDGNFSFSPNSNFENPVALSQAFNNNKTFLLLGSFFTQLEIVNGLTAETRVSVNYNNGNQESFYPRFTGRGGWSRLQGDGDGFAQDSRSNSSVLQWQSTLTYSRLFGLVHQLDAVLGTTFEEARNSFNKAFGTGFSNGVLSNVSSATVSNGGDAFESASGLSSYFGRINYDYDQKYFLTLTSRVDGSSKFAKENKYAFFPAAALAWRISGEPFLSGSNFLNELKFRSSIGLTGQQDFGAYQWRTLFETDDYGGDPSIILSQLGNDRLKWETTKQFDIGLDFSILNDRISGSFGYYQKDTEDAIFPVITPGNTGVSSVLANVGSTKNTGFEIEFNADIIRARNFSWNININLTKNANELTKIGDDFKDDEGFAVGFPGLGGGRLKEGSPIGLIYGYVSEGIFQQQSEIDNLNANAEDGVYQDELTAPGDLRFKDISGPNGVPDGKITSEDQTVIGDAQPDFFGGINSTWTYKGFTLAAQFTYSYGNDLFWFSQTRAINFGSPFLAENKTTEVLNAWTPENPTNQPRAVYRDPNNNARISSYYVHDASFLRLNTINLRYTFSKEVMKQIDFIDSISIYGIAQNLWTLTDYPGANPQSATLFNNDISGAGRDTNRFPLQKAFTFGINIGF
ncbi:TonB-dependent receptor [Aquimarina algicola]|uniref:TonB-dependent receptor n=1 Tax=Aquimarina algicola TaxID=2589995 RepID=A0A504J9B8_9FLAO|nr:TonB-dependent receptor [Aquimarina algicola]TPN82771.1 TonB-dependent receptor [Aquimarina algicola]